MRFNETDIKQFKSIRDVYAFVENKAFQIEHNSDIGDLFLRYRNHTIDETEKQHALWEFEFSIFHFKGAKLFSFSYEAGQPIGEVKKYPDLNKYQQDGFTYLKNRSTEAKAPIFLARYNHLLWCAPAGIKHKKFALAAIDNYIKTINESHKFFVRDGNRRNLIQIGQLFETLAALCNEVKSGFEELKALTSFLLFEATNVSFYIKHGIVEDMLAYPTIFKKSDFENVLTIYRKEVKENRKQSADSIFFSYRIHIAIEVANKTGTDVKRWHNEIGLAYLRFAKEETQQERLWIKLDNYARAIHAFTSAGNKPKKNATEKLYAELKPKVTLPTIEVNFSEEDQRIFREFQEQLKKITSDILKSPPDEIYKTISIGLIFPTYQDVLNEAESNPSDFTKFATTVYFDRNKNITKQKKDGEDKREIYSIYQQQISFKILPYLHYLIVSGIKSGHLTFENFINYLAQRTWIGKPYLRTDLRGQVEKANWITILSPSILEYFVQVQAWGNSKYYNPNFVLCIDSLTLKMEGLFRNFCERLVPVSVGKNRAMQEAYIHNLLDNETIKRYFNEDDLFLFNYLFSSDFGMNLRNNVAHCFYQLSDYHPDKMLLLIAALLRIGKYDHKKR